MREPCTAFSLQVFLLFPAGKSAKSSSPQTNARVVALPDEVMVLKFGSSVLRTAADLPNAVHEVYRWYRQGLSVIVVVSAIGEATDRLLAEARQLTTTPEAYATAELLATGERSSAALLGVALDRSGIPARMLNPCEIGLTVKGSPLESELTEVNLARLR